MIRTLGARYPAVPIEYSGYETGLAPSLAVVALGASFVERHITLDWAMWGTDQAASVELVGFERLIRNIHDIGEVFGRWRQATLRERAWAEEKAAADAVGPPLPSVNLC
jgi:N-acetylneuraminate synthase